MSARGPAGEAGGVAVRNPGALSGIRERMLRSPWSGASLTFGGATSASASSTASTRTAGQRHRWIARATDCDCHALRAEDWRQIVAEVWQARESRWVLQRIRERPVKSDQVVAFKALVLMHRLLQQGPIDVAAEWELPNALLDEMVSTWTFSCQTRVQRGSEQMHCVQAVIEYAKLLTSKMELMVERDAGCGRFNGSLVFDQLLVEPSDLLQALGTLLNYAEKLMRLTSHLVSPSKDWRRLERSQYMHLYVGGILALLHEAWLLLCAVSLHVKNLLCQVHEQKQREDSRGRHAYAGRTPPWLQLALHLLAAQPRFVWFHQSMCDFVAHCHQLRVAGFRELAPFIPTVPQSLLNLFADLGELVKGLPHSESCKDPAGRTHDSISTLSTALPSDDTPGQHGHDSSWEPSPCVMDALRSVDSMQLSAIAAAGSGNGSGESESEPSSLRRSSGSAGEAESSSRGSGNGSGGAGEAESSSSVSAVSSGRAPSIMQSTVRYLEERWPHSDERSKSQPLCEPQSLGHGYALLDDDEPETSSASGASARASPSRPAGDEPCAASPASCQEEEAPLVAAPEEEPEPVPFVVWPVPGAAQWCQALPFQGYDTIQWPPEAHQQPNAAVVAPQPATSITPPRPAVAPGLDPPGPVSWATAICRSNISTSRSSIGETSSATPCFRRPLWHTEDAPTSACGSDAVSATGSAAGAAVQPSPARPTVGVAAKGPGSGRTPRGTSTECLTATPVASETATGAVSWPRGSGSGSAKRPSSDNTNPFELRPEASEVQGASSATPVVSHTTPINSSSAASPSSLHQPMTPSASSGPGLQNRTRANSFSMSLVPDASARPTVVGAPLRVELPGVKPRSCVGSTKLDRGRISPSERTLPVQRSSPLARPPSLRHTDSGTDDGAPDRANSALRPRAVSGTPREASEAHRSPHGCSPRASSPFQLHARQARAEDAQPLQAQGEPPRLSRSPASRLPVAGTGAVTRPLVAAPADRSPAAVPQRSVPAALTASPLGSSACGADWEVDPADLRLEEMVGSGTTAEVYRGSWFGTDVAVKKLRHSGPLSTEFTRELSVLLRLRHPNLVLFMGAATAQAQQMIISEFCAGGTVFTLLHQSPTQFVSWRQRLTVAVDVAKGMNFLHRRQVVHRDLKSLNLLLAGRVTSAEEVPAVKISDFGLSRIASGDQKVQACMTSGAGTYHWMAPEVLDGQKYDEKVDVYSYGICLFELLSRRIPYDGSGLEPVSIAVAVSKGRRPDLSCVPQDCPADLRFTMECCWAHCPTGRPGFDTILETLKLVQCP